MELDIVKTHAHFYRNFQAPLQEKLEQGITVLDSGCGPAAWVFDMAKDFPNSQFHGIDITSTFPHDTKPSNCEFTVANLAEGIPYPDNYFDYVHQRLLILGLTNANWDFVSVIHSNTVHAQYSSFLFY